MPNLTGGEPGKKRPAKRKVRKLITDGVPHPKTKPGKKKSSKKKMSFEKARKQYFGLK